MEVQSDAGALIEATASAASLREYECGVLEILRRRLGFDVAMFKRGHGVVGTHGLDPTIEHACRSQWLRFGRESAPVLRAAVEQRGVAVDVEVLGMRGLEQRSYYQLLMRPHRGTSTAIISLMRRGVPAGCLALGRTRGGFNAGELDYLRALTPALSVCETAALAASLSPPRAPVETLTPRECEVLSHLPLGHTNAQIALALGSAERTVRNQLSSIYEKLGVATRAEAAALCSELGWSGAQKP